MYNMMKNTNLVKRFCENNIDVFWILKFSKGDMYTLTRD